MLMSPAPLRDRARQHASRPTGLANVLIDGPDAADALRRAVGALGRRPARLIVMPDVAADVAPVADELGLRAAGRCTLMGCDLDLSYAEAPSQRVERALDADALTEVSELVAAAFGLDGSGEIIGRELTETQDADAWLLRNEDGHAISAVIATADPDFVGLWSVATPPAAQRRGHGAHLVRAVLGHYALEGVTTACVLATEAGEQLYRALGFQAAERLDVWMKRS